MKNYKYKKTIRPSVNLKLNL